MAGPFFFKSGLAEKVIKESEGMIVASFGDVSPNPDVAEDVYKRQPLNGRDYSYNTG